ncbi:peptidoglycan-binding protein, partial [Streptomyces sp. NPDC058953]
MPEQDDDDRTADPARRRTRRAPDGLARRRRLVVFTIAGSVLLAGAGVAASRVVKSPAQLAAEAEPPRQGPLTAPVERRVLTSSVITRGKVTAAQTVEVAPRSSGGDGDGGGRTVVTQLAVRSGQTLKPGTLLMEVSGRPVFVLPGALPVYRDLRPGAEGRDVAQLQRALRGLGHGTGNDRSGVFGSGTKAALGAFYAALGYDPVPATSDDGSALREARATVAAAERALEDALDERESRSTGPDPAAGGTTPGPGVAGTERVAGGNRGVERAREDLAAARQRLAEVVAATGPTLPAAEVVFLTGFPARVGAVTARVGTGTDGGAMTLSAGAPMVTAEVAEHQKDLVRAGQRVRVLSELTGISFGGEVVSVGAGTAAVPPSGEHGGQDDS